MGFCQSVLFGFSICGSKMDLFCVVLETLFQLIDADWLFILLKLGDFAEEVIELVVFDLLWFLFKYRLEH